MVMAVFDVVVVEEEEVVVVGGRGFVEPPPLTLRQPLHTRGSL